MSLHSFNNDSSGLTQETPSVYQQLLYVYQSSGNLSLEARHQAISRLPTEVVQKIFQYIRNLNKQPSEYNSEEVVVLESSYLQKAIDRVTDEFFLSLQKEQKYAVLRKIDESWGRLRPDDPASQMTTKLLMALNELSCLLPCPQVLNALVETLKNRDDLLLFIPKLIPTLGIKDQNALIVIAKLCAQKNGAETAQHIQNFGIQDQNALIAIAKLCAQQNGAETAKHIKAFCIQDEAPLIATAQLCAQQNGAGTALNIQNFGIQDQNALIAIAKLCAQQNGWGAAAYVQNFGIQDQDALIVIAKLCALQNGEGTALNIQNFGIQDQNALIAIAKLCAQQNGAGTAQYIQKFGIQDQDALIAIAKLCAQQNGWQTAAYIRNFRIEDHDGLIAIAKLCALQNGSGTAEYIRYFCIGDQNAIIAIAKLCAQQNGWGTAIYIQNFGILSLDAIISIAKLCARQNGAGTAQHIQKFGIQDQNALIAIAKLCAQQNGAGTAQYIQKFGIQDQNALIAIAKLCAQQNGMKTAEHIKEFGIQDQDAIIAIAKLCAQQNGEGTAALIQNFGIKDKKALLFIGAQCLIHSIAAYKWLSKNIPSANLSIADLEPLFEASIARTLSTDLLIQILDHFIIDRFGERSPFLENLNFLAQIKDLHAQQQAGVWMATVFFFIATMDQRQQEEALKTGLIEVLRSMRSPSLRSKLSSIFLELATNENPLKSFQEQSHLDQAFDKRALDLLLFSLQSSGVSQDATSDVKAIIAPIFKGDVEIRPLLEMLHSLHHSERLTLCEKQIILEGLCAGAKKENGEKDKDYQQRISSLKPELKKKVIALLSLLLFGEEERLLNEVPDRKPPFRPYLESFQSMHADLRKKTTQILSVLLHKEEAEDAAFNKYREFFKPGGFILFHIKQVLQEKFSLKEGNNQIEKFYQLFMTERNVGALAIYAAKLASLGEAAVMDDLARYVNGVVKGSFHKDRYSLKNNPHLRQIASSHAPTLQGWQRPLKPQNIVFSSEAEKLFDAQAWLKLKLLTDQHMNPTPQMEALLNGQAVDESALLPIEKPLRVLIAAQTKEEQIASLKAIQQELAKLQPCEFSNDVARQIGVLQKETASAPQEVSVADTDDYLDLLLAGTEVVGSCQNVNGTASLNKGLLGYILDGKNRLIAVKDKRGHIMARAKLSLLWDGEKPALFLERLYTNSQYEGQCRKAITEMALAKAKALGLPLTALKGSGYLEQAASFDRDLQALGSGVSYEYSDALVGVQKGGVYQIGNKGIAVLG